MATIKDGKGTLSLSAFSATSPLALHEIGRPTPGKDDISIKILFCGMCHSDLHATNGDWGIESFPLAPGHEIAGVIQEIGSDVTDFKVGDEVAVGCFVSSCKECIQCKDGCENYCCNGHTQTYSQPWPAGRGHDECVGYHTNGGYSSQITVDKHFVFHVPKGMKLEHVGPLLCAGITMYAPINKHVIKKKVDGLRVGILGFGGLGNIGAKLAKAAGANVTMISRSLSKANKAKELGCDILAHSDAEAMADAAGTFDVIIDTVSLAHDIVPIMTLLKKKGVYHLIGGVAPPIEGLSPFLFLMNAWSLEGSLVGGVPETQEMLDFCAKNNIVPCIKIIHAKDANEHFEALHSGTGDAIRAVIDMKTINDL